MRLTHIKDEVAYKNFQNALNRVYRQRNELDLITRFPIVRLTVNDATAHFPANYSRRVLREVDLKIGVQVLLISSKK